MLSSIKYLFLIVSIYLSANSFAQTIQGTLVSMANMPIKMEIFNGVNTVAVEQTFCDEKGFFSLNYSNFNNALCLIKSNDEVPFALILNGENISLDGLSLNQPQSISVTKGDINILFNRYKEEIARMEQAYGAWLYLNELYVSKNLNSTKLVIEEEILRIEKQEEIFINNLPQDSYLKWYLQQKKTITSVGIAERYRREKISSILTSLRTLNYADEKWYGSGLMKDLIDSHFWLLMTTGNSIDSINQEMKVSVDVLLESSFTNEKMYNAFANYLFEMFEHQNLVTLSEYLSYKLQSKQGCVINDELSANLNKYGNMKTGSIAPEIFFLDKQNFAANNNFYPQKLSNIKASYTLVVFGSSSCPHCQNELPKLAEFNTTLNQKNIQVVLISLDDDSISFNRFVRNFPFISYCDYTKSNSKIAHDYFVFATPAMFLLNSERKILLKPNSILHLKEWIEKNMY